MSTSKPRLSFNPKRIVEPKSVDEPKAVDAPKPVDAGSLPIPSLFSVSTSPATHGQAFHEDYAIDNQGATGRQNRNSGYLHEGTVLLTRPSQSCLQGRTQIFETSC